MDKLEFYKRKFNHALALHFFGWLIAFTILGILLFPGQIERGERALSAKTLKKVVKYTGVSADFLLFGKETSNETIQKINNILTVNSKTTSDFIYHIVMCSNDFCKKIKEENEN